MKKKSITSKKRAGKQQEKSGDKIRIEVTGQKLRRIRLASRRSQSKIAQAIGSSQGYISKLDNIDAEHIRKVNVDILGRYIESLGGHLVITADFPADKVGVLQEKQ